MSTGENIKYLRKLNNFSQSELAEKLFISRQTISKWENDVLLPDLNNLVELASLFNCSIDNIISGSNEEFQKQNKRERILKFLFLAMSIVSFLMLLFLILLDIRDVTTTGSKFNPFVIFAFVFYFMFLIFITLFVVRIVSRWCVYDYWWNN